MAKFNRNLELYKVKEKKGVFMTFVELGKKFNISRQRARVIYLDTLKKIQKENKKKSFLK